MNDLLQAEKKKPQSPQVQDGKPTPDSEKGVRIDGYAQVLELLKVADPAFRESLLKRLAQSDPALVQNLRKNLKD